MGQIGSKDCTAEIRRRSRSDSSNSRMSASSSIADENYAALSRRTRNASTVEKPLPVPKGKLNRMFKHFKKASKKENNPSLGDAVLCEVLPADSESSSIGNRPQMKNLDDLVLCTGFSREELQRMYRGFKNDCPSGFVCWGQFKKIYADLYPFGDSSFYARFIFNHFDSDKDGKVTFEDFAIGLSRSIHGSLSERLKWSFQLYDIDNDGNLTKEKLTEVVEAVYKMLHLPASADSPDLSICVCGDPTIEEQVEDIFKAMDTNDDGIVKEQDFVAACLKDPSILRNLAITNNSERPDHEMEDRGKFNSCFQVNLPQIDVLAERTLDKNTPFLNGAKVNRRSSFPLAGYVG